MSETFKKLIHHSENRKIKKIDHRKYCKRFTDIFVVFNFLFIKKDLHLDDEYSSKEWREAVRVCRSRLP